MKNYYIPSFEQFINEGYLFEAKSDSVLQKTEMKDFHGKKENIETVATLLDLGKAEMSQIMKVAESKFTALESAKGVKIAKGANDEWVDKRGETIDYFLKVVEKEGQKFVLLYEMDNDDENLITAFCLAGASGVLKNISASDDKLDKYFDRVQSQRKYGIWLLTPEEYFNKSDSKMFDENESYKKFKNNVLSAANQLSGTKYIAANMGPGASTVFVGTLLRTKSKTSGETLFEMLNSENIKNVNAKLKDLGLTDFYVFNDEAKAEIKAWFNENESEFKYYLRKAENECDFLIGRAI
jgi:hypothetical protein